MAFVDPAVRRLVAALSSAVATTTSSSSSSSSSSAATAWLLLLLLSLAAAFCIYCAVQVLLRGRHLPPGPWHLRLAPKIDKEFHLFLGEYSAKYGKMFSFRMGLGHLVVLSDPAAIRRMLAKKEFVPRPKSELMKLLAGYGIVNSEGDLWKSNRRFLLNNKLGMKNNAKEPPSAHHQIFNNDNSSSSSNATVGGGLRSSSGIKRMESLIQNEVVHLLKLVAQERGVADPEPLVKCAVANVVGSMVMSTRFRHDDTRFQRFMHLFDEGFRLFVDTGLMTFMPILRFLPKVGQTCAKLRENRDEMVTFVREVISEHRSTLNANAPRDLIDNYLIKQRQLEAEGEEAKEAFYHGYDPERQLEQIVLDLFSAGIENVSHTLLWSMVYMLHNPEVMQKVQAELNEKVGEARLPTLDDCRELPYTRATMCEVMRMSSVVPTGVTHSVNSPTEFDGYTLPANVHIVPLLHSVHHDPSAWDEPEFFRPERFLSADGADVVKPPSFMPFGTGQRVCIGDRMAEQELFLFFASLLHVFSVRQSDKMEDAKTPLPSLRGLPGASLRPAPFKAHFAFENVEALVDGMKISQEFQKLEQNQHIRIYG